MSEYLYLIVLLHEVQIHSFVLMPNHFHLIVLAPKNNLAEAMNYFMRETSKEISRRSGRINQVYGGRNYKSVISSHHYFLNAYKYVYRNPVRAGLVDRVEAYPYSTLNGLTGFSQLLIPLNEDTVLFNENFSFETLEWLNQCPNADREDEVRRALKKTSFKLARVGRFESSLEMNLL